MSHRHTSKTHNLVLGGVAVLIFAAATMIIVSKDPQREMVPGTQSVATPQKAPKVITSKLFRFMVEVPGEYEIEDNTVSYGLTKHGEHISIAIGGGMGQTLGEEIERRKDLDGLEYEVIESFGVNDIPFRYLERPDGERLFMAYYNQQKYYFSSDNPNSTDLRSIVKSFRILK